MIPYIFHIDIYFIFLREWKSVIFRLLINCFNLIQNKHLPMLWKPVLNIAFVYDDELLLFKQTYLWLH
jgi:hypothetical protein